MKLFSAHALYQSSPRFFPKNKSNLSNSIYPESDQLIPTKPRSTTCKPPHLPKRKTQARVKHAQQVDLPGPRRKSAYTASRRNRTQNSPPRKSPIRTTRFCLSRKKNHSCTRVYTRPARAAGGPLLRDPADVVVVGDARMNRVTSSRRRRRRQPGPHYSIYSPPRDRIIVGRAQTSGNLFSEKLLCIYCCARVFPSLQVVAVLNLMNYYA